MNNERIAALTLGFILLWLMVSFSSCATQKPILQPVLVTFYKNGMPLDIRGQADSMIFHGHKFDFVAYPDSDVVNGREKIAF